MSRIVVCLVALLATLPALAQSGVSYVRFGNGATITALTKEIASGSSSSSSAALEWSAFGGVRVFVSAASTNTSPCRTSAFNVSVSGSLTYGGTYTTEGEGETRTYSSPTLTASTIIDVFDIRTTYPYVKITASDSGTGSTPQPSGVCKVLVTLMPLAKSREVVIGADDIYAPPVVVGGLTSASPPGVETLLLDSSGRLVAGPPARSTVTGERISINAGSTTATAVYTAPSNGTAMLVVQNISDVKTRCGTATPLTDDGAMVTLSAGTAFEDGTGGSFALYNLSSGSVVYCNSPTADAVDGNYVRVMALEY